MLNRSHKRHRLDQMKTSYSKGAVAQSAEVYPIAFHGTKGGPHAFFIFDASVLLELVVLCLGVNAALGD